MNGARIIAVAVAMEAATLAGNLPVGRGWWEDGSKPYAALIQDGSTLYGTTRDGGWWDWGTVFSLATDGTDYQVLHEFAGTDGGGPEAALIQDGSTLYGTTAYGRQSGNGTVFSLATDGTDYQVLHDFGVPEPSSFVFFALGSLGVLARRRRKAERAEAEAEAEAVTATA